MIDRGAHERQPERDVHAAAERGVLEHRQSLVVVHGEHAVRAFQALGDEERIGRQRSARFDAGCFRFGDRGGNDVPVLSAEVPRLAAVRIEPRHEDPWFWDTEAPFQILVEDAQGFQQILLVDGPRYFR